MAKFLYVKGDEYSAMSVEDDYGVARAYKEAVANGGKLVIDEDFYAECTVKEFGEVDTKFYDFVIDALCDYDALKHTNLFAIEEAE